MGRTVTIDTNKASIEAFRQRIESAAMVGVEEALEEWKTAVISEAKQLCPVRKAFKNPSKARKRTRELTGKFAYLDVGYAGRGSMMLKRGQTRSLLNKKFRPRSSAERAIPSGIVLGTVKLVGKGRGSKRTYSDKYTPVNARAKTITTDGSQAFTNFHMKSSYRQKTLTARARWNLKHGEGVRSVNRVTPSGRDKTTLVYGGALKESIHDLGIDRNNLTLSVTIVADAKNEQGHEYGPYVEYGSFKDYAQPFLRPAIKNSERYLPDLLKAGLATNFVVKG